MRSFDNDGFAGSGNGTTSHQRPATTRDADLDGRTPFLCETAQRLSPLLATLPGMSERNGDRARFHKARKRKLHQRQRIRALRVAVKKSADDESSTRLASLNMHDEGSPVRDGD
jgi:hypothetical protein